MNVADYTSLMAFDVAFPTRTTARAFAPVVPVLTGYRSLKLVTFKPPSTGGSGSDTIDYVLQEAGPPNLTHQNSYDGVDDGGLALNAGSPALTKLAIPFTQDAVDYRTPIAVGLWLSRVGTPAGNAVMEVSITKDATGDPGASVGQSYFIDVSEIPLGVPTLYLFGFGGCYEEVADSGDYWVKITPYYNVSAGATDCIKVHFNTVAGSSACKKYESSAWTAIANNDLWFHLYQLTFTDVSNDVLEGGGAIGYAQEDAYLNTLDSAKERSVDLRRVKDYLRFRYDISAGTWYVRTWAAVGMPDVSPPPRFIVGGA